MPVVSRRGQGFGEAVAQLCNTWNHEKIKHTHTHREMKARGNSKKWKREEEKREERTIDELCGGINTEQKRKIGEPV